MDIYQLCDEMFEWQSKTFGAGPHRVLPPLKHLQKELKDEIIDPMERGEEVNNLLEEYTDCFFLLINSLYNKGYDFKDLESSAQIKLAINMVRRWGKPDKDGVVEHLRSEDKAA